MMLCSAFEIPRCVGAVARLRWSVAVGARLQASAVCRGRLVARQYVACLLIEHVRCIPCGLCDVLPVIVCVCPGL